MYKQICTELNKKYYKTEKTYETYDYPYEKNDGHTETAISLGKAEFSSFWNFNNLNKKDDYISVEINQYLEVVINYEHGELTNAMVNLNKEKDLLDY